MKFFTACILVCAIGTGLAMADDDVANVAADAGAAAAAGDWQKAESLYRKLIGLAPEDVTHELGLGRAQMMQKQYSKAVETLSRARANGAAAPVDYFLARSFAGMGNKADMLAALKRIHEAGGTPYASIMAAPEFRAFDEDAAFTALVDKLRPCQSDAHRAFDFWIGKWDVYANGTENLVGHNTITAIEGGCVLHEQYHTPGSFSGQSFNFYDASRGVWHQTWADNQGTALYIEGGIENGSMVLTDAAKTNRITFTPAEDGSVRQHWETSSDGGKSWATAFDGRYVQADDS